MKTTITLDIDHKKAMPLLAEMAAQRAYTLDGVDNVTIVPSVSPVAAAPTFLGRVHTMVALQDKLNAVVNPNWLTAGNPWHRAIMVEGVELLEHVGWKWWKKQEPDIAQAKMELVDIWHFALSMFITQAHGDLDLAARDVVQCFSVPSIEDEFTLHESIDQLVMVAASGHISELAFVTLMRHLDLSWGELYTTYIAKNVLNIFRQDHGYRAGSYKKDWNGVEDNAVLSLIMTGRPNAGPQELYEQLEEAYKVIA